MKVIPVLRACDRCGMPLRYEAAMNGRHADSTPASGLCGHCAGLREPKTREPIAAPDREQPGREWLLDAMIDVLNGERRALHRLASLVRRLPVLNKRALGAAARLLDAVPQRDAGSKFDAMVLYSGGKDSTYMLIELARRRLRVCAWMLDPGYQSPQTIENAKRVTGKLGVPLFIERADRTLTDALFRAGFAIDETSDPQLQKGAMTYGSACWPCFSVIAVSASRFANQHRIALCFIGTQQGQNRLNLDGAGVLESSTLPRVDDLVEKFVEPFKQAVPEHREALHTRREEDGFPTVLVPFYELVRKPAKAEQLAHLAQYGWVLPKNTGACSSNCMINELGRAVMRAKFGFDLYQVIDANERRLGHAPDQAAYGAPDARIVRLGATMLGLDAAELDELGIDLGAVSGADGAQGSGHA